MKISPKCQTWVKGLESCPSLHEEAKIAVRTAITLVFNFIITLIYLID